MSWSPPDSWTEVEHQLRQSGQVTLDSTGNGVLFFSPAGAHHRWVVRSVVVQTNQTANATTVPVAQLALNTTAISTMSQGNNKGASWSGNQDIFQGEMDVGPCDFLTVLFTPPPGSSAAQIAVLAGVIGSAVISGQRFVRRT